MPKALNQAEITMPTSGTRCNGVNATAAKRQHTCTALPGVCALFMIILPKALPANFVSFDRLGFGGLSHSST